MSRSTAPPRGPRRPRAAVDGPASRPDDRPLPHTHAVFHFQRATAAPTAPPLGPARRPRPRPARGARVCPAPRSGRAPAGHPDRPRPTSGTAGQAATTKICAALPTHRGGISTSSDDRP